MDDRITDFIRKKKKKTVELSELERLFPGDVRYDDFVAAVRLCERSGLLTPYKGQFHLDTGLSYTYHINSAVLREDLSEQIRRCQVIMDHRIRLDSYFSLSQKQWELDLPYIEKISAYIKAHNLPTSEAAAPERSYNLVGDEKWIDEKGGRKLLNRLGLWDAMLITSIPEPLMLAVNPHAFGRDTVKHLIVENKTTYYELADFLPQTGFLSLIYGAGWRIVSNIQLLESQLNLRDKQHRILYFGDLDYEGITIWYTLNMRRPVLPALDFYRSLMKKRDTSGKENQTRNDEALASFLSHFTEDEQNTLLSAWQNRHYWPQEGLSGPELRDIWRNLT